MTLISLNIKVLNSQDNHFQGKTLKLFITPCLLLPDMLASLDFLQLVLSFSDIDDGPANSDPAGSGCALCWRRL